MNLFGLEGSGFIISLGITLLLSALIMYYCVQRINSLEQSLVKQGEIIQTFIYKLNNLELQNNSNLETNFNTDNQIIQSKIDVSDDEDDDDEDDDDEEDVESDNEEHIEDNDNIKLLTIDSKNSNFLQQSNSDIESDSDSNSDSDNQSISDIEELKEDNIVPSSDISSLENLQDISLNKIEKIVVDDDDINDNNDKDKDKKVIEINNDDLSETINYSKMKVNELRELAVKKNLVKSTDNTKYKKDELIQLLQK
jgi:hypothetical protein